MSAEDILKERQLKGFQGTSSGVPVQENTQTGFIWAADYKFHKGKEAANIFKSASQANELDWADLAEIFEDKIAVFDHENPTNAVNWGEQVWRTLQKYGLTRHSNEHEELVVVTRFVALLYLFLDFHEKLFEEYFDSEYYKWYEDLWVEKNKVIDIVSILVESDAELRSANKAGIKLIFAKETELIKQVLLDFMTSRYHLYGLFALGFEEFDFGEVFELADSAASQAEVEGWPIYEWVNDENMRPGVDFADW